MVDIPNLTPLLFIVQDAFFHANAVEIAISNPATNTTIPRPAPPAVASMGVIPNRRNPNVNLASFESIMFS